MIFLNNVFITHQIHRGAGLPTNRGNTPLPDKLDIYKYTLASLAHAYPWKKAFICFTLDEQFRHREAELIEFIEKEWGHTDLTIKNQRIGYVWEWQNLYESLDDELIWYFCNHDHVFVDNQTKYLYDFLESFKSIVDCYKQCSSIYFSHYPENIYRYSFHPQRDGSKNGCDEIIHNNLSMLYMKDVLYDSIQIITNAWYKDMWFNNIDKDWFFPRSDYIEPTHNIDGCYQRRSLPEDFTTFIFLREICRHFDAYTHARPQVPLDYCPTLTIPDGFFSDDMKLSFYEKKSGYTYCDPMNPHHYAADKSGADYKFDHRHIPFFWKNRISDMHIGSYDEESLSIHNKNNIENLAFSFAGVHSRKPPSENMLGILQRVHHAYAAY